MTLRSFMVVVLVASTLGACTNAVSPGIQTSVEGYIPFDGKLKIN